jgi:hypothetical protein
MESNARLIPRVRHTDSLPLATVLITASVCTSTLQPLEVASTEIPCFILSRSSKTVCYAQIYKCNYHTTKDSEFEFQWGQEFSLLHVVQTGYAAHPNSYPKSTEGSFPVGKVTGA